jgi:hypothetical protein
MRTRIPNTAGIIDHRLLDQSLSNLKTVPKKGVGASILRGRELTVPLQSCFADPNRDPDPSVRMFLGLVDSDPLVRSMDPDPDPSIIKQK